MSFLFCEFTREWTLSNSNLLRTRKLYFQSKVRHDLEIEILAYAFLLRGHNVAHSISRSRRSPVQDHGGSVCSLRSFRVPHSKYLLIKAHYCCNSCATAKNFDSYCSNYVLCCAVLCRAGCLLPCSLSRYYRTKDSNHIPIYKYTSYLIM